MPQADAAKLGETPLNRWRNYFIAAVVLIVSLYGVSRLLPIMPPLAVALVWAAVSGASAVGVAYHAVIKKEHTRLLFQEGGRLFVLTAGYYSRIIISFILASACIAVLFLSAPGWDAEEWLLVAISIPLFYFISIRIERWSQKEFVPEFQHSYATRISVGITCALLCVVAFFLFSHVQLQYADAADAYHAFEHPLVGASSALIAEIGEITSLTSWFTDYLLATSSESFPLGFYIARCVIFASALFGFVSLLGTCSLKWDEIKRVFIPASDNRGKSSSKVRFSGNIAAIVVLSLCLIPLYLYAESKVAAIAETEEHSLAEQFIHDQINIVVYEVDGKYLDSRAVEGVLQETKAKAEELSADARKELSQAINDTYDAYEAKVDDYLDWYYSLKGRYELLAAKAVGDPGERAAEEFTKKVIDSVDTTQIDEILGKYEKDIKELEKKYNEALDQCEIVLPEEDEWLVTISDEPFERIKLELDDVALAPVRSIEVITQQMGISATAGVATGALLGGVPVAAVATLGAQYLMLKADEASTREPYRQEIIEDIEIFLSDSLI